MAFQLEAGIPEVWVSVPGWEGYYQVSNYGRVKSCLRWVIRPDGTPMIIPGKIHTPKLGGTSWRGTLCGRRLYVKLTRSDKAVKSSTYLVHRLVAAAFLPNGGNKEEVNHVNADPLDNKAWNLEWNTPRENKDHATRLGLMGRSWSNIKHIIRCNELGISAIGVGRMCEILRNLGYNAFFPSVLRCIQGSAKSHRGLTFRSILASDLDRMSGSDFMEKLGIPH